MYLNIYEIIVNATDGAFRIYVDAENEKKAAEKCVRGGKVVCHTTALRNPIGQEGEIVRIKDVTTIYQSQANELNSRFQSDGLGGFPIHEIIGMLSV